MNADRRDHREVHGKAERLIERELSGEALKHEELETLRGHLRECDRCRRVYDRYVAAEAQLFRGPDRAATPGQLQRVERRLLGDDRDAPGASIRGGWKPVAMVGAMAALAAVVLTVRAPLDEFQPRGGARPKDVGEDFGARFRALSVQTTPSNPGPDGVEPAFRELNPGATIDRDVRLVFLGACSISACTVSVTARTADGQEHEIRAPHAIVAAARGSRLGDVLTLPANWPAGDLSFRATFYARARVIATRTIALKLAESRP